MRALFRSRGAVLGAAVLLSAGCRTGFRSSAAELTTPAADQMRSDVTFLASRALEGRGTGTAGNDSAAVFIARRYNALRLASIAQADRPSCATGGVIGKAECFVLPFTASVPVRYARPRLLKTQNVAAIIPGSGPLAGEYVIVGAHFDHVGRDSASARDPEKGPVIRPGADDNGSGTVAVMEIARRIAQRPTNRSVIVVNFSGEELGLLGSLRFANNLPVPKEKVQAMVNLDMVGRMRNDKLIVYGVATATEMKGIVDSANVEPKLTLAAVGDGEGPSDHAAFYRKDLPVLHLFTDLHDDYHSAADVADRLNYAGLVRIADYTERVVRALADRPGRLTFQRVQTAGANRPSARPGGGAYLGSVPDMGAADVKGMQLSGVRPGSPAEKGGLKAGDIIIKFGAKTINNIYDYTDALGSHKPGDVVEVIVQRVGGQVTLQITLGTRG
ncbi:MAG: M20/M25/M40 family metallo-hydrolase [Gemmatimonadaceae bacterium]|nr:M20/M25/M40 family metallo-hydrolase [Gemmatimonadaceae bacterium]